jgi:hypothetical protein
MPRRSAERGVALPMALMTLALLGSLMLAFASLSRTEPVIAVNHLRAAQARALAESGLEYALWALSHPAHPAGLPSPLPGALAAAPFDGRTFVALRAGGFTVEVRHDAGGDPQRRTVTAVGWVPSNSAADLRPKAHRMVTVDVVAVPQLGARAPCALCVKGALTIAGTVTIDGRNADGGCGDDAKYGALSGSATTITGAATLSGGGGASGQQQPADVFEPVTLSAAALEALRTLAWRHGTYYGPGFPRGGTVSDGGTTWPGRVTFDAANPVPDGVLFVDTTDGRDVAAGGSASLAEARFDAGAFGARAEGFRGWIIVNGSMEIAAGLNVRGLVYAVDALTYRASDPGRIEGLAISLNVQGASSSRIEAVGAADVVLRFDCGHAGAPGLVPHGFLPIPGTYREDDD